MSNSAKEALKILEQKNINSIDDYHRLMDASGSDYDKDLFQGLFLDIYDVVKYDLSTTGAFHKENDYKDCTTFESASSDILKYTCMFPQTSIYLRGEFEKIRTEWGHPDGNRYKTADYFETLFKYKKLIQNGVFKLLPQRVTSTVWKDNLWDDHEVLDLSGESSFHVEEPEEIAAYHEYLHSSFKGGGTFLTDKYVEKLFIAFPWLYGVNEEDYIEIIEKNKLLYKNYCASISRFIEKIKSGDLTDLKYEIDQANISIQIELDKEMKRLKRKGITTIVGIAFAFIPILAHLSPEVTAALTAIMGGKSFHDLLELYSDNVTAIKQVGYDNPFWLTYEWGKNIKKQKKLTNNIYGNP